LKKDLGGVAAFFGAFYDDECGDSEYRRSSRRKYRYPNKSSESPHEKAESPHLDSGTPHLDSGSPHLDSGSPHENIFVC
jgi:hypothetical protein